MDAEAQYNKRYEAATAERTDRESLLRASVKRHIESQPHQPTQWVTPQSPVLYQATPARKESLIYAINRHPSLYCILPAI